jgi:hypothetical protein
MSESGGAKVGQDRTSLRHWDFERLNPSFVQ